MTNLPRVKPMNFSDLLNEAGLTKTQLAENLGVQKSTISAWKGSPPQYVIWGLLNYIEARDYRTLAAEIRKMIK